MRGYSSLDIGPTAIAVEVLNGGGTVLVINDYRGNASSPGYIDDTHPANIALIGMGSTMRIGPEWGAVGSPEAGGRQIWSRVSMSGPLTTGVSVIEQRAMGRATSGDAVVLGEYLGYPYAMVETIDNGGDPPGTIVMIMDTNGYTQNVNLGSDGEQFLHNIYWDAVTPRCTVVCDKIGFFGGFNDSSWSIGVPRGYEHLYGLGNDGFLTEEMGTVFMGFNPASGSLSIPSDATASIVFLSRGGTIVVCLEKAGSLLDGQNAVDECNLYLEAIGADMRWTVYHDHIPRRISPPFGNDPLVDHCYDFKISSQPGRISRNRSGRALSGNWAMVEYVGKGRLVIIADSEFFTSIYAPSWNRGNNRLISNIVESGECTVEEE